MAKVKRKRKKIVDSALIGSLQQGGFQGKVKPKEYLAPIQKEILEYKKFKKKKRKKRAARLKSISKRKQIPAEIVPEIKPVEKREGIFSKIKKIFKSNKPVQAKKVEEKNIEEVKQVEVAKKEETPIKQPEIKQEEIVEKIEESPSSALNILDTQPKPLPEKEVIKQIKDLSGFKAKPVEAELEEVKVETVKEKAPEKEEIVEKETPEDIPIIRAELKPDRYSDAGILETKRIQKKKGILKLFKEKLLGLEDNDDLEPITIETSNNKANYMRDASSSFKSKEEINQEDKESDVAIADQKKREFDKEQVKKIEYKAVSEDEGSSLDILFKEKKKKLS